ncbi:hypothetical protein ACFYWO_07325 [Streptomyces sp. NPDC002932]|uniref:hypothetical protein n=1 Tax=Streptomyces sp. NPDC002932 TaxID=3364672 RepID=UPI0036A77F5D
MAIEVTEDFTAFVVHTEISRSTTPATGFECLQQLAHERCRGRTPHRVPDTDDRVDETPGQG